MLPKVIDLFSGCGGMALGFEKAGFQIATGIDIMPDAIKTISYNLAHRYGREETHILGDITQMDGKLLNKYIGKEGCIVVGGPPCQAYSTAGKGKLRSLGEHRINTNDSRGYLYQDFLRFVFDLKARAVIMENVPESTNFGGENIPQLVCEVLESKGYDAYWTILNSADFGVPQIRERVFVFGIRNEENKRVKLPIPTHKDGDEIFTINQKKFERFNKSTKFKLPISNENSPRKWITVGEAFSDLPILFSDKNSKYKLMPLNIEMQYRRNHNNEFQDLMRSWYGKETTTITGLAFRKNIRDFPIFDKMKQGDNYLDASKIADNLFREALGFYSYEKGSLEYEKLKKKMVPKSNRNSFENKWKKLDEHKLSHTVVAHLSKDTYSHIHPWEPRGISVREAARLQSFPDDFYFNCTMGNAFRQIGNAVPPLLAYGIAKSIRDVFKEAKS